MTRRTSVPLAAARSRPGIAALDARPGGSPAAYLAGSQVVRPGGSPAAAAAPVRAAAVDDELARL